MAGSAGSVQSITRVLDIIETLSTAPQGMTLSDLSVSTNLHISTTHRLLTALVERGYARKDSESGKYRLTLRLFEIGGRVSGTTDLLSIAKPLLDDLANFSQEAIHLVQRDGSDVVYLYKSEPFQQLVRMASYVGCRNPMYCTAVGKSILAMLSPAEIQSVWENSNIYAHTEKTITTLERLQKDLEATRKRGYSIDDEENEPGVRCSAMAIRNWEGKALASVSVSAPASRLTQAAIERIYPQLRTLVNDISRQLGYIEPPAL